MSQTKRILPHLLFSKEPDSDGTYAVIRADTDSGIQVCRSDYLLIKRLYEGKSLLPSTRKHVMKICTDAQFLGTSNLSETIRPQLSHIPNHFFSFLLSPYLLMAALFFVLSSVWILFTPNFRMPTFRDYFWTDDVFWVLVSAELIIYSLGFLHEVVHYAFTRAVGGQARINFLSYRLFDLVFETESYHLAVVPKYKRYLVYLSGPVFDLLIVSSILWYLYAVSIGIIGTLAFHNILLMTFIIEMVSLAWQFNVYLQTDVYNYISEKTGIYNLYQDTQKYLQSYAQKYRGIGHRFLLTLSHNLVTKESIQESDDLRSFTIQEKRKLITYSGIVVCGYIFSTFLFVLYTIPKDLIFVGESLKELNRLFTSGTFELDTILKNLVVFSFTIYSYFVLMYFVIIKRRKRYE